MTATAAATRDDPTEQCKWTLTLNLATARFISTHSARFRVRSLGLLQVWDRPVANWVVKTWAVAMATAHIMYMGSLHHPPLTTPHAYCMYHLHCVDRLLSVFQLWALKQYFWNLRFELFCLRIVCVQKINVLEQFFKKLQKWLNFEDFYLKSLPNYFQS